MFSPRITTFLTALLLAAATAVASADVQEDLEDVQDRLDKVELRIAKHKVSIFGDFRVRYDYQKWNLPAYNQFLGMDFTDPNNPVPRYQFVPASELENTEAYSARLRLKMDVKLSRELHFTGRLNVQRGFGAASVPLFNGFPNTVATAFNSVALATDDVVHLERAALTWDPRWTPLFATVGRQAATGGPPRELREDRVRQATPGALMIDAQIDGVMLGLHLNALGMPDGSIVRLCYGTGYESGFGSGGSTGRAFVTTYVPDVTDPTRPGLMAMPVEVSGLEDTKVAGGCAETPIPALPGSSLLTLGYFRLVNMTDIPYGLTRGFPNPMNSQEQVVTATANLGDMDLVGVCFQHSVDIRDVGFDWFASWSADFSHPDPGTASAYGFGSLLGDAASDENGWAVYAGMRAEIPPTSGKLGFEYNHGSKNWFSYTPAADDVNAKLATRGDVFEGYYIQPVAKKLDLRLGYQYYAYDYAFSGWHISPAPIDNFELSEEPFLPYPYPDTIHNLYVVLDVNF